MRNKISWEELNELLIYDHEGFLRWRKSPKHCAGRIKDGAKAGYQHYKGCWMMEIGGKSYMIHQLVWFLHFKKWPKPMVDHKDRNKSNNRIENLRCATNGQNRANSRANKNTKTGLKGVVHQPKCTLHPYGACISIDGVSRNLGWFTTAEEAHQAYLKVARKKFKNFFHDGST